MRERVTGLSFTLIPPSPTLSTFQRRHNANIQMSVPTCKRERRQNGGRGSRDEWSGESGAVTPGENTKCPYQRAWLTNESGPVMLHHVELSLFTVLPAPLGFTGGGNTGCRPTHNKALKQALQKENRQKQF